ncbi:MAG: hypothetical protein Kow0092_09630 [Deferrisomatales bacterium]
MIAWALAGVLLVRTIPRVRPGQHLAVARELRRRIKEAFDREGIEVPYARRVLILQEEEAPAQAVGAPPDPAGAPAE